MKKDNFIIPEIELPGIYGILNVENGKIYVGSSVNLKNRLKQQRTKMRSWNGLNNLMRKDFQSDSDIFKFVFVVFKVFPDLKHFKEIEMREEEREYIEKYTKKGNSYNVHKETFAYA